MGLGHDILDTLLPWRAAARHRLLVSQWSGRIRYRPSRDEFLDEARRDLAQAIEEASPTALARPTANATVAPATCEELGVLSASDQPVHIRLLATLVAGAGEECPEERTAFLSERLKDPSEFVRRAAAIYLDHVGTPDALALVVAGKGHGHGIRHAAALKLKALGPAAEVAIPGLIQLARGDNGWRDQFIAADALVAIGPAALPTLLSLLTDADRSTQTALISVLEKSPLFSSLDAATRGRVEEIGIDLQLEDTRTLLRTAALEQRNGPASPSVVEQVAGTLGAKFPRQYLELLSIANGFEGFLDEDKTVCLSLYEVERLPEIRDSSGIMEDAPHLLPFAGDDGGTLFCLDIRTPVGAVVVVDLNNMHGERHIGVGVLGFLDWLALGIDPRIDPKSGRES